MLMQLPNIIWKRMVEGEEEASKREAETTNRNIRIGITKHVNH